MQLRWATATFHYDRVPEAGRDSGLVFILSPAPYRSPRSVQKLSVYLCFPLDDSYTPATLAIRAGTGTMDLQDTRVLSLDKPDGWFTFDVSVEPNEDGDAACVATQCRSLE